MISEVECELKPGLHELRFEERKSLLSLSESEIERWSLEALDDTVGLESREGQIEKPEAEEEERGENSQLERTAKLAAHRWQTSQHHHQDGYECKRAEKCDGEGQASWHDNELCAIVGVVNGCRHPCQADAEENVDGVRASYVSDRTVGVLILYGSYFAGERIYIESKNRVQSLLRVCLSPTRYLQITYLAMMCPERQMK